MVQHLLYFHVQVCISSSLRNSLCFSVCKINCTSQTADSQQAQTRQLIIYCAVSDGSHCSESFLLSWFWTILRKATPSKVYFLSLSKLNFGNRDVVPFVLVMILNDIVCSCFSGSVLTMIPAKTALS